VRSFVIVISGCHNKEGFVPRKGKVYPLLREEREEVREFVKE